MRTKRRAAECRNCTHWLTHWANPTSAFPLRSPCAVAPVITEKNISRETLIDRWPTEADWCVSFAMIPLESLA